MERSFLQTPAGWWRLIAGYLVLNGVARLLILPHTLWIDEAEQVYMSQWLSPAAFEIQPPLYSWIHYAAFQMLGPSMLFLQVFKIAVIIATYYGLYRLMQHLAGQFPAAVVLCLASLPFIPQLWDETLTRTNTILVTCASVWAMYVLIRLVEQPRWYWYAALGVLAGVGFLSKYTIVLGFAGMALAGLGFPASRKALLHPMIIVSLIAFLLVVWPHLGWFVQHLLQSKSNLETELGSSQPLSWGATTVKGLSSFAGNSFGFIGIWAVLMLLLLWPAWRQALHLPKLMWSNFLGRYLLVIVTLLLFALFFFGMTTFYERYFQPFYIFIPVWLFAGIAPQLSLNNSRSKWLQWLSLLAFLALFYFNHIHLLVQPITGKTDVMHIPYQGIADSLRKQLQPGDLVVTNRIRMAGNLRLNLGQQRVLWTDDSLHFREELERTGVNQLVYVWHVGDERLPSMPTAADVSLNNFDSSLIKWVQVPYGIPADRYFEIGVIRLPRR